MARRTTQLDIEAAIKLCASEPTHIPGNVQPHGALIAVDNATLKITYASDNTASFLRVGHDKILGKTLKEVFARKTRHDLVNGIMLSTTGRKTNDLGVIDFAGLPLVVTSSAAGDTTIFEFEVAQDVERSNAKLLQDLEFLLAQARTAGTRQELFDKSVELLQMVTGYDRALIYALDDNGNGEVVAETVTMGLTPFLGLHFPAWDIPAQARELMAKTPLRYVADVAATPSMIHAAYPRLPELDMTQAHLRGTSRIHMEYLANMGVSATFTLNVVLDGELWGMISLHHSAPRYPGQHIRQMCRSYLEFFNLQLQNFNQSNRLQRLQMADDLRRKMSDKAGQLNAGRGFEAELLKELTEAMEVDGAALIYKNTIAKSGVTPSQNAIEYLAEQSVFAEGISATAQLSVDYPHLAQRFGAEFTGVLVVRLADECSFFFFRKARDRKVRWAGAPEKEIRVETGRARLSPRASFSEYTELVKGASTPWTSEQSRIAEELWTVLLTSEREELINKTNRKQSLLIDELNHRVRNILSLIRSLSRQTLTHNGSIRSYVSALEARISAVAAAHDLGAEKSELSTTLSQIFEQEAAAYNQDERRVRISGDDIGIRSDLFPMVALVVHELMTNAAKFGRLSNDRGYVDVHLLKAADGMSITWREAESPTVIAPAKKGFGTTLIEASVPFELDGGLEVDFKPEGLLVKISLPASVLVEKTAIKASDVIREPIFHSADPDQPLSIITENCLLVEDNYVVSLDTARVLKSIGFKTVETALNVPDALAKIDKLKPGIAILDITLSAGKTSAPIAQALSARGVPFVFVTGYGDTMKLDDAFAASPVLKKPICEDELRCILAEIGR